MGCSDRHVGEGSAYPPLPVLEALECRTLLAADLSGTVAVSGITLPDTPADPGAAVRLTYERNPDPGLNLESYTVKLVVTDPQYVVSGFDGRFDGPMSQVWTAGGDPTPTLTRANLLSAGEMARDSHILFENKDLVFGGHGRPAEDRSPATGVGSWMANDNGTNLAFAFDDLSAGEVALAQVVVPAGEQVVIAGEAAYRWDSDSGPKYGQHVVGLTIPATEAVFSVEYTVRNTGDVGAAPFWVDLYRSSDTSVPGGDTLLERIRIDGLAAGAVEAGALTGLELPGDNLDADWYVGMVIDADGDVPESDTLNNQAVDQVLAQTPSISISDGQVVEGNGGNSDLNFAVTLSAASSDTVSVHYATANDTAAAGDDYVGLGGTLVFDPGQTARTLAVPVVGDAAIETDETFAVHLDSPVGATIADGDATGTIFNDDSPTVSVDDVTVTEGDAGTAQVVFTVSLSGAYDEAVAVDYATTDHTAEAGMDYTSVAGSLAFAPGETVKTVAVTFHGDADMEVDETFHLDLSAPVNASIGDGRGTATILNDDGFLRGFDAQNKVSFLDADGDLVTVSMKGPGTGQIVMGGPNGFDPDGISVTGTTARTKVTVATKGKGSSTTVRHVNVTGELGSFLGKTLDLLGSFTTGPLTRLTLRNVTGDHVISIGPRAASDRKTTATIVLGRVTGASLVSLTPLKSLTVIDWRGSAGPDQIAAPWIRKLTAKGNKKAGIAGDLQANLDLSGQDAPSTVLRATKIAGGVDDATWTVAGNMGKLKVVGAVTDSTFRSEGSMAGVTVGASIGSDFLAGIDPAAGRFPEDLGDFDNVLAAIKSFNVKGIKGAGAPRWFFSDSNVSAATIRTVKLLNVEFDNGANPFGIRARDAGTGKEIKSVKWSDKINKTAKGSWTPKAGLVFALPDLAIEILST